MQISKTPDSNLYQYGLKVLNIIGPVAGISLVFGISILSYFQTRPQQLPITYKLTHGNQTFYLETATKAEELQKGLKFRTNLPSDRGMLFHLGKAYDHVGFWMYQVKVPLDIVFLNGNVVDTVITNASPCPKTPCPVYFGNYATQVLEIPAGTVKIKVGEKLNIEPFKNTK